MKIKLHKKHTKQGLKNHYYTCYGTSAICPSHYLLYYDIAEYWLSTIVHYPQLITLKLDVNVFPTSGLLWKSWK